VGSATRLAEAVIRRLGKDGYVRRCHDGRGHIGPVWSRDVTGE
jgi:hypothetical protein